MAEKNSKPLTPFQKELIDTAKQILEYKTAAEANVVAILYKVPDEFYNTNLTLDDFSVNTWRVFFQIAHELVLVEKKNVLDDMTVGFYLEKHPKLKDKYEEYGGYDTIASAMGYVNIENLDGYISELRKWKVLIQLCKRGVCFRNKGCAYSGGRTGW